jgi:hypothetical protein
VPTFAADELENRFGFLFQIGRLPAVTESGDEVCVKKTNILLTFVPAACQFDR